MCLLILISGTFGALRAQDVSVRFPSANLTAGQAIEAIEQQTEHVFSYAAGLFDPRARVAFSSDRLSLNEALDEMLRSQGFTYMLRNKYIILRPEVNRAPVAAPVATIAATGDVYQKTAIDSLDASPLHRPQRPTDATPAVTTVPAVVEQTPPPTVAGYSDYQSLDRFVYRQNYLPKLAVKTNLLYGAGTLTPNLSVEAGLGPKTSLALSGSYNPWNRIGELDDNDKLVHWVIRPEFRYWFCERFDGHFVGANLFYDQYNIGGHTIPFVGFKKEKRYEGNAYGLGINYGYHLPIGKRWGLEFSAGIGVARLKYDLYDCKLCSVVQEEKTKTYFGPTHASVSLVFMIR